VIRAVTTLTAVERAWRPSPAARLTDDCSRRRVRIRALGRVLTGCEHRLELDDQEVFVDYTV